MSKTTTPSAGAHTHGDWTILFGPTDDNDEYEVYVGVEYPNHCPKHVARVYGHGGDYHNDPEMQANARLISAAPDLAAALESVVGEHDSQDGHVSLTAIDLARAALNRAYGKEGGEG